jgi:hypothetical protein
MSLGFVQSRTLRGDAAKLSAAIQAPASLTPALRVETQPTHAMATTGIPFHRIRAWNAAMALFHSTFFVVTMTLGNVDLRVDLYATNVTFVDNVNRTSGSEPRFLLLPSYRETELFVPLTIVVATFFAVTAFAHVGNAFLWRRFYEGQLALCRCPTRWIEYAVSASVMITVIAIGAGVREYTLLFAIGALIGTTMSFGLLTEVIATCDANGEWRAPLPARLTPHLMGYVPQLCAWLIILVGFYDDTGFGDREAPWFVYLILWIELALFFSFGLVQLVQQLRSPAVYWQGEIAYLVLSLVAKGALGVIILANVLMLSSFEEAFE